VNPDDFLIQQVQALTTEVVQLKTIKVAALQLAFGMDGDDGASQMFEGYHFWLQSQKQPQVLRMSCYGVFEEPGWLRPPTLLEIRATLGDIASISH